MSKQCRALQRAGWEKDAAAVLRLAAASDKLVQLHLEVRITGVKTPGIR